jgi:hypothetical protein
MSINEILFLVLIGIIDLKKRKCFLVVLSRMHANTESYTGLLSEARILDHGGKSRRKIIGSVRSETAEA